MNLTVIVLSILALLRFRRRRRGGGISIGFLRPTAGVLGGYPPESSTMILSSSSWISIRVVAWTNDESEDVCIRILIPLTNFIIRCSSGPVNNSYISDFSSVKLSATNVFLSSTQDRCMERSSMSSRPATTVLWNQWTFWSSQRSLIIFGVSGTSNRRLAGVFRTTGLLMWFLNREAMDLTKRMPLRNSSEARSWKPMMLQSLAWTVKTAKRIEAISSLEHMRQTHSMEWSGKIPPSVSTSRVFVAGEAPWWLNGSNKDRWVASWCSWMGISGTVLVV